MTITPAQMRAAGRELRRRRSGEVKKDKNRASTDRPFGAARLETLRRFAAGERVNIKEHPSNEELSQISMELALRDSGMVGRGRNKGRFTTRPFEQAQTTTLRELIRRGRDK